MIRKQKVKQTIQLEKEAEAMVINLLMNKMKGKPINNFKRIHVIVKRIAGTRIIDEDKWIKVESCYLIIKCEKYSSKN